ncbi:hypothetical protein GLOTRDRAFT_69380 [Gloeophyllum trabeum ATCC 11539]|uniref:DUF7704 domain-containing protein n=1 Tax=Gloeophyllum trabeum (strain ATCC 11539 / FP-39264 / Madison 617) TaxID=670483 RepID=S7S599_GLOTA|nr:uncharacterized protein GLOTRDRAFT_69380 [Gloeophyllum trabeum ATCC 11539]EPQ61134.1 hypothetical protein GLOTRDRAFT_69380 [Gloeophyllum trabeum ATCC 11539]
MVDFPALPGFYKALFLYVEPISTMLPAIMAWTFPGAAWFHRELIPPSGALPTAPLDRRSQMAIWQLGNCYLLLGLISSFVFRAVRDALPGDPVSQERILGASFTALAIADLTHVIATFVALPPEAKLAPGTWNPMTHGNITFTLFLLCSRLAWFNGIGRKTYYYGVKQGGQGSDYKSKNA